MYEPAPVHILIDQKFANRSESYSVSFFLIFRCRRKKRRKRPSYLFPSLVQNHKMMALRCLLGRTPKPSLGFRGGGGGVKARNYTLIRTGDSLRKWDFPDPQLPINEDFPGVNHVIIVRFLSHNSIYVFFFVFFLVRVFFFFTRSYLLLPLSVSKCQNVCPLRTKWGLTNNVFLSKKISNFFYKLKEPIDI